MRISIPRSCCQSFRWARLRHNHFRLHLPQAEPNPGTQTTQPLYSAPITVSTTTTITAIACASRLTDGRPLLVADEHVEAGHRPVAHRFI